LTRGAPGIFSASGIGWGPARSSNSKTLTAAPGGTVQLFATGFSIRQAPRMFIAGQPAKVISATVRPDKTIELTVAIPNDAAQGCFVPVHGIMPNGGVSNTVTVAIWAGGRPCGIPASTILSKWSPGKMALLVLERTPAEARLTAVFSEAPETNVARSPLLLSPPSGACTAYGAALDSDTQTFSSLGSLFLDAMSGTPLDAGSEILIASGQTQLRIRSKGPGLYQRSFDLGRGPVHIVGTGGTRVGRFRITIPEPDAFTLDNADPWNAPLTWTGLKSGWVVILITSFDTVNNLAGLTQCVAPAIDGRFRIPREMLTPLPKGKGELVVMSWPSPLDSTVNGMESAISLSLFKQVRELQIR
jgi:hypothetical protein